MTYLKFSKHIEEKLTDKVIDKQKKCIPTELGRHSQNSYSIVLLWQLCKKIKEQQQKTQTNKKGNSMTGKKVSKISWVRTIIIFTEKCINKTGRQKFSTTDNTVLGKKKNLLLYQIGRPLIYKKISKLNIFGQEQQDKETNEMIPYV